MYPREEPFPRGGLSSGSLLKSSSMSRYPLPLPLLMPRVVVGDESCSNRSVPTSDRDDESVAVASPSSGGSP